MSPDRLRWFLPETPDCLAMLRAQSDVACEGIRSLAAWARGDAAAAEAIRDAEHRADDRKHELRMALTQAFSTEIDPEDIYVLSTLLDEVLNQAKNAVRESEVMAIPPDEHVAGMAELLARGVENLRDSFGRLGRRAKGQEGPPATEAADAAVKAQRDVERVYRQAMSSLLEIADLREVMGRRELYRRFSRMSDTIVAVAERVWYAYVKES